MRMHLQGLERVRLPNMPNSELQNLSTSGHVSTMLITALLALGAQHSLCGKA